MQINEAKFNIGQIIAHKLFDYRGVIADVDPFFQGTEEWYEKVAQSQPPKDKPWYRVLVDNATHETYVAEKNLRLAVSQQPVQHPLVNVLFGELVDGIYSPNHFNT